jgi:hypothetical protein
METERNRRKEEIEAIEMPIHSQNLNPEGDIIVI